MKKRIICFFLSLCFVFSNTAMAFADDTRSTQKLNMIDFFATEHYEIATYCRDDMVYVITRLSDGRIELAFGQVNGQVRTIWFDSDVVFGVLSKKESLSSASAASDVIAYGVAHQQESIIASFSIVPNTNQAISRNSDYQTYFLHMLYEEYGTPHTNFNWTGMHSQTLDGLTYNYKENLSYGMTPSELIEYPENFTIGALKSAVYIAYGVNIPVNIIKLLYNLSSTATSIVLACKGVIGLYQGSMVRTRFVMINGSGPYFQCYQRADYDCWVKDDEDGANYEIDCSKLIYSHGQSIFFNHAGQRDLAYENYI